MIKDLTTRAAVNLAENVDLLLRETLRRKMSPRAMRNATDEYLIDEVQPLLDHVEPSHISHNVLRRIERKGLSVRKGLSFRANMIEMSESRKFRGIRPSWALDQKNSAYSFLDALGVRRPASDDRAYSFEQISKTYPSVIKATKSTGARGCYLVFSPEKIVHVRDHAVLRSWEELEAHARDLMSPEGPGARLPDQWMLEELIIEDSAQGIAARNVKFYCFYGEIVFVQESRREPDLQVTFYTPENEPVVTGRYEDLNYEGVGVRAADVEIVKEISRSIPFPFMRIDMLNGEDGLVFGEFTPRPGNYDQLNDHWDRVLGEAWVRAEARILEDLLRGKSFAPYLTSTKLLG